MCNTASRPPGCLSSHPSSCKTRPSLMTTRWPSAINASISRREKIRLRSMRMPECVSRVLTERERERERGWERSRWRDLADVEVKSHRQEKGAREDVAILHDAHHHRRDSGRAAKTVRTASPDGGPPGTTSPQLACLCVRVPNHAVAIRHRARKIYSKCGAPSTPSAEPLASGKGGKSSVPGEMRLRVTRRL